MMYLFVGPFAFGGLANIIVPLQIGAPDMAFPRLNALSYWLYLSGSITMLLGFFVAGGPADFGWTLYAPLSNAIYSPGAGPDLFIAALLLTGFSAIFTGVNICATDLLPARAGHDDVPDADLHLEHARRRHPHPARVPRAHRGAHHALLRPAFRDAHLHGLGRWRARAVAAHLLVLGPPRGVHPRAAVLRHRHRRDRRVLAQARLRVQGRWSSRRSRSRRCRSGCGRTTCSRRASCCSRSSRS